MAEPLLPLSTKPSSAPIYSYPPICLYLKTLLVSGSRCSALLKCSPRKDPCCTAVDAVEGNLVKLLSRIANKRWNSASSSLPSEFLSPLRNKSSTLLRISRSAGYLFPSR